MLVHIPAVLTPEEVTATRAVLDASRWIDGRSSAGQMASSVKANQEADLTDPPVRAQSDFILRALSSNTRIMVSALPARICPPSFNRYTGGQHYGTHNDAALLCFSEALGPRWVRTDLAATIFLAAPQDYDGGELVIEDTFGPVKVKLPAGDAMVYPASSQHRVEPVTRGARVASFVWLQSLVRDDAHRRLLYELDGTIMRLNKAMPGSKDVAELLGLYHNLLRMWSDT
jgi:PKHD-type hydroxylase